MEEDRGAARGKGRRVRRVCPGRVSIEEGLRRTHRASRRRRDHCGHGRIFFNRNRSWRREAFLGRPLGGYRRLQGLGATGTVSRSRRRIYQAGPGVRARRDGHLRHVGCGGGGTARRLEGDRCACRKRCGGQGRCGGRPQWRAVDEGPDGWFGPQRRSSGDRFLIVVVRRGSSGRSVKSQHFFVRDQSGVRSCVCGLHCREKCPQRRMWIRWLETHERRRQRASRDDRRGIELPGGARGHEHQPPWHPCRSVAANFADQQCQKSAELRHAGLDAWRQMHFPGVVKPDVLRFERHVRRLDRVHRYTAAQLPDERGRVIRGERH